ncbi:MAG: type II toxin-antitoxin system Phd/YefM family antitoxin [Sphaerobacteraceae bacterium]|nr:MAG: type II toxin-antitoxin system Phd/YefM family antitoxin [Sphaerobacteraceae bacterium]
MRSIPAREIKRRGISAVDEQLKDGPVYIIKNDEPSYVVLSKEQYEKIVDFEDDEPILERVRKSMEEYEAGQYRVVTADELIEELELEEE